MMCVNDKSMVRVSDTCQAHFCSGTNLKTTSGMGVRGTRSVIKAATAPLKHVQQNIKQNAKTVLYLWKKTVKNRVLVSKIIHKSQAFPVEGSSGRSGKQTPTSPSLLSLPFIEAKFELDSLTNIVVISSLTLSFSFSESTTTTIMARSELSGISNND
uniref:Uncharacterized protein n=1 Tax=Romanomermis culicivorax TaxID=13658 RepID=A0A915KY64_ROMCU